MAKYRNIHFILGLLCRYYCYIYYCDFRSIIIIIIRSFLLFIFNTIFIIIIIISFLLFIFNTIFIIIIIISFLLFIFNTIFIIIIIIRVFL